MNFDHFTPTKIIFGRGRLNELGALVAPIGQRALVVCGRRFARSSGLLQRVDDLLRASGITVTVFDEVSANPTSDEVDRAAALARRQQCDMVLGVGGGSAIDAAKAVAASIDFDSVRQLVGTTLPADNPALPIVAIPTTAGTGSEVTKGAIIKDVVRGFKSGVRGDCVFPRLALIDPDLSAGMPKEVAIATAFDALTHAIETYVGRAATPITDALAEKAIHLFAMNFRSLLKGDLHQDAHEALCLAALFGGLNVANAGTCLPHRLQQALGAVGRIDISHAQGLAAVYPSWISHAYSFAAVKFDRVARLLGFENGDLAADMAHLLADLGLPSNLSGCGFASDDIERCLRGISGNLNNDPIDRIDAVLLRSIYAQALDESKVQLSLS